METACSTLHDGSRLSARHEKDFSHFVVALIVSSSISIFIINSVFLGLAQCYGKMPIVEGKRLTVCVTCAGAGTAKPSSQKKAKAWKLLGMCAESPASGARFVGTLYGTGVTVPIIFGVGMAISTSVISLSGRDMNLNILLGSHLSYHNSSLQNSMINFVDRFLISRKYT